MWNFTSTSSPLLSPSHLSRTSDQATRGIGHWRHTAANLRTNSHPQLTKNCLTTNTRHAKKCLPMPSTKSVSTLWRKILNLTRTLRRHQQAQAVAVVLEHQLEKVNSMRVCHSQCTVCKCVCKCDALVHNMSSPLCALTTLTQSGQTHMHVLTLPYRG